jgi:hypothetical protein
MRAARGSGSVEKHVAPATSLSFCMAARLDKTSNTSQTLSSRAEELTNLLGISLKMLIQACSSLVAIRKM